VEESKAEEASKEITVLVSRVSDMGSEMRRLKQLSLLTLTLTLTSTLI